MSAHTPPPGCWSPPAQALLIFHLLGDLSHCPPWGPVSLLPLPSSLTDSLSLLLCHILGGSFSEPLTPSFLTLSWPVLFISCNVWLCGFCAAKSYLEGEQPSSQAWQVWLSSHAVCVYMCMCVCMYVREKLI